MDKNKKGYTKYMEQNTQAEVKAHVNVRMFTLGPEVQQDSPIIEQIRRAIQTGDKATIEKMKQEGTINAYHEKHNLITTRGRNVLARLLAGDTTYSGQINYGALGTGTTAVANSDTQLATEVYRKIYASHTTDGANVTYVDFFYAATDTNGTYTEFGNFIDGTGSANSGRIFSHILTGGWTKTSLQSLFVSCQYTIN